MRAQLEELERIDRPSASEGERRAAEWLVERFAELGAEARIEAEDAHGTYWWPLGIGAALGALGGIAGLRGRRLLGGAVARRRRGGHGERLPAGQAAAAPAAAPPHHLQRRLRVGAGGRRAHGRPDRPPRRRPLGARLPPAAPPRRRPAGTDRAQRHQPAADGAGARRAGAGRARRAERQAAAVQARRALRRRHRRRRWRRSALRDVVPGANDNGTAVVALLALAERLLEAPTGEPAGRPPLGRLGGVLQRGDEGLRRAPLPEPAAGEHLLPLPRDARLPAPAGPARRGLPEDARVPAALARR